MFSPRIEQIIRDLAAVSEGAASLSTRLLYRSLPTGSSLSASEEHEDVQDPLVTELQSRVLSLTSQVNELQAALDEVAEPTFTDEELSNFRVAFERSLKDLTLPTLTTLYSLGYFRSKPKSVRLLIATSLVNEFSSRNGEPSPLWVSLIARNGTI